MCLVVRELSEGAGVNCSVPHHPNFIDCLLDQTSIMGDQKHPPLKLVDGLSQCLNRLHVQVICGLVKQQNVGRANRNSGKCHTGLLSSRQVAHLLQVPGTLQPEIAQNLPAFELLCKPQFLKILNCSPVQGYGVNEVLAVPPNAHQMIPFHAPRSGLQKACHQIKQGSFPNTIRSAKSDSGSRPDGQIQVHKQILTVGIMEGDVGHLHDVGLTELWRFFEWEIHNVVTFLVKHHFI
mmetsp:Transcript_108599/g.187827  ORF Transcript_108599/g.187827 Transcript_108599/m.187827 type:complete len:236 (+) Transcript_108599:536-1243(+)